MRGWLTRISSFSGFARGGPGVGLLLLRMVCGAELIVRGILHLQRGGAGWEGLLQGLAIALGVLITLGLGTLPVAVLIALLMLLQGIEGAAPPFEPLLLGTVGVALALLGPGRWSLDARLFGWQRLRTPPRSPAASRREAARDGTVPRATDRDI